MDMKKLELPFQFKDAYKKLFSRITCSLLTTILTILLTFLIYANDLVKNESPLFWPIIIVTAFLVGVSIFQIFNEHKKEELYIYHEYLQKEFENIELNLDRKKLLNMTFETRALLNLVYVFSIMSKTEHHINLYRQKNVEASRELLSTLISDVFFVKLREFFGQKPNEHFSVAIYLYDREQDILWDFVSKKDKRINPKRNSGRTWKRTDLSHIAFCFNHESELIHSDITERFNEFGIAQQNTSDEDLRNYKSAITLPIFFRRGNEQRQIVGVFCLTSDNIGTFHETNENVTDPIYSLKILALRMLTEIIADNIGMLYENNPNNIKRLETTNMIPN